MIPFVVAGLLLIMPSLVQAGELLADQVQRDPYGMIHATGNVQLKSKGFEITAKELRLDVDTQAGELVEAKVEFDGGHKFGGDYLQRIDLETFYGENIVYSHCPEDEWAWAILAESATLDREGGTFTAKHARFEWGGIPIFYTPRWEHALSRRSGFLMPELKQSTRRGTEFILPFYWAASPNWDMTLSPHWMSKRGTMAEVEWRHRSSVGAEMIQIESIYDQQTETQRGRLRTDMGWNLTESIDAALKIDAVGDGLYIADFPSSADNESAAYLTSTANMVWHDGSDSATLSSRYQQLLGGAGNAPTLQILPRLQTRHYFNVGSEQGLKLEHQSTIFRRDVGVSGLRVGVRPSWSVPWQMQGGAVSAVWSVQGQYVGYESDQFTSTSSSYGALASSLQVQGIFEKILDGGQWRHEIKPIVRLDVSSTKDQSNQPLYDSSLLPLNLSNILRGSRYSGWDRFERMRRVSMLLSSTLQKKEETGDVRTVVQGQVGLAWDDLQQTVDAAVAPAPTRAVSNILAELSWMPFTGWRSSVGGQHDYDLKQWVEAHASIQWAGQNQQHLNMTWQRTDETHSQEAEALGVAGKVHIDKRWSSYLTSQYDLLRDHMIHATVGINYNHSCWNMALEGFKTYQVGSDGLTDIGWRFLLAFEGLGSFGDK